MPLELVDLNIGDMIHEIDFSSMYSSRMATISSDIYSTSYTSKKSINKLYNNEQEKLDKVKLLRDEKIMKNYNLKKEEITEVLKFRSSTDIIDLYRDKICKQDDYFPINILISHGLLGTCNILGYWFKDKAYSNITELKASIIEDLPSKYSEWKRLVKESGEEKVFNYIIGKSHYLKENVRTVFSYRADNKLKITSDPWGNRSSISTSRIPDSIPNFLKIKIVGSELSGKLFGLATKKKELEGTIIPQGYYSISTSQPKKLEGESIYILKVKEVDDRNNIIEYKFLLNEVEFFVDSINGYHIPKDKTIKADSEVRLISDISRSNLYKDTIGVVKRLVKRNLNSKKIESNSDTRKLDVFEVNINGKLYKIFGKYLKLNSRC